MIQQDESSNGEQQPAASEFDSPDHQVSLPSDELLQLYYERRLPKDLLDQFDLNCVRYQNWRQVVAALAFASLRELTRCGRKHMEAQQGIES